MPQVLAAAAAAVCLVAAGACGAAPERSNSPVSARGTPTANSEKAVSASIPINQRFRTLDEYLEWLRRTQAPVDGSWYEEVRPGVYQLRTGNLRVLGPSGDETPAPEMVTREELEKKLGFR